MVKEEIKNRCTECQKSIDTGFECFDCYLDRANPSDGELRLTITLKPYSVLAIRNKEKLYGFKQKNNP